jgi:hypothetical protein
MLSPGIACGFQMPYEDFAVAVPLHHLVLFPFLQ